MASDRVIYMKQNDTKPDLVAIIADKNNVAYDLTNCTVKFHMADSVGTTGTKINVAGSITSPTTGEVQYTWASGDLDTVGTYYAEFEITFSTGAKMTAPAKNNIIIIVTPEIA